jgi:hypothetical protein
VEVILVIRLRIILETEIDHQKIMKIIPVNTRMNIECLLLQLQGVIMKEVQEMPKILGEVGIQKIVLATV